MKNPDGVPIQLDPELVGHASRHQTADFSLENLATLRARAETMGDSWKQQLDGVVIEDRKIRDVGSDQTVAIRIYRCTNPIDRDDWPDQPKATDRQPPQPAVLEIHGGGFVLGGLDMMDTWCQAIATMAQAVVVSVDYRLAPEHPFPAAFDDCYATLCWMARTHRELGIDPNRIAVVGQSAGAALAAGVCLAARDRSGPSILHQMLEIPQLDDRLDTPSAEQFVDAPLWTTQNARDSWTHYLGTGSEADHGTPMAYAAPGRAAYLEDLPPAYISTMQYDPLRDEGIEYAQRLLEAGVPVELHSFAGTFHGAARVGTAEVAKRIALESITVLRRVLHHSPARSKFEVAAT